MLRTVAAILLAGAATIAVAQHAGTKDPPIRRYGLDDGLNQRLITSMVQDDDGYLWVGSFGGLNRFDGLRFESFTTRNGLRENLVQSLFVDTDGALWIGDAAGGLTVLDGGRTVRTIDPPDGIQSDIRGITQIGRTIFASSEYSGLYAVSMNDDSKPAYKLPFEPSESHRLVADSTGTLWLHHGDNRLGTIDPRDPNDIHDIATNVVAVALDSSGAVFVASERGHLGRIDGDAIDWFDTTDRPNLTNFVLDNDGVAWLSYGDRLIDYRDATEVIDVDVEIAAWPLVDRDDVLWLPSVGGLIRYLGNRFEHYPLNLGPDQSTVFSLLTDAKDRFWLGTATGVQVIAADGSYTDINELAGIDGGEIRGMHLSPVGDYVWVADIDNGAFRIDTDSLSMQKVFPDSAAVLMDLTIDDYGKIWASSYLGVLYRHDPASGRTQTIDLGHESAVYSMSVDSDGWLWFSWSYKGIYRLNTALDDPVPERVVAAEEIGRSLFAHINVVDTVELGRTVWLATTRGGLFRWSAATGLERHAGDSMLSDQTVFSVQPLADGTVALGTERGAYHYDPASAQLQFFGPLAGFKAVEAKTHATYIHTDGSLWFGTANGITRMDVSRPIAPSLLRAPAITSITVGENTINPALTGSPLETDAPVQIEFVAVSTVLPGNIEYSHRLRGESDLWSEPTTNRTIKFASLPAGDYTFEVRARSAGNLWSQPTEWSFSVPAPFWQSTWFIAVAAIALVLLGRGILYFRLHQVEQSNQLLSAYVVERTHAIELARQALQDSHNRLQEE
ncbi:MAG: two-component regulator propeller domain-containing protein, partial [Pseudomonadota bacterium]